MRRRRRFSSRRAVRRLMAALGPEAQRVISRDPEKGVQVTCSIELAESLQLVPDFKALAAVFDPAKREYSVVLYGRDA